jgi:hypothetical protein
MITHGEHGQKNGLEGIEVSLALQAQLQVIALGGKQMDSSIPRPVHVSASMLCILPELAKSIPSSPNPLPINLNLYPTQVHIPRRTRFRHTRRQPGFRLLVVERPLRYGEQESESSAAQADVESFVDVLGCEADEHGDDAACDEEEGREGVGEGLAAEVLDGEKLAGVLVLFGFVCGLFCAGEGWSLRSRLRRCRGLGRGGCPLLWSVWVCEFITIDCLVGANPEGVQAASRRYVDWFSSTSSVPTSCSYTAAARWHQTRPGKVGSAEHVQRPDRSVKLGFARMM